MVGNTVGDCLQRQIAQKIFRSKIKAHLVNTFKHSISFATNWLQTLVAIDSESYQTLFPSIWAPPSEVAVLFYSNLSKYPFLGQVTFHLLPIGLRTLVTIDSELCQTSFPSICAPPFEIAVLFNLNLSRRPFLRQVIDLDLLLCTGFDSEHEVLFTFLHAVLFIYIIFLIRDQ